MAELNVTTLGKWEILSHLVDEDLAKLVSAHIFEAVGGLGALLLTTEDEVYYVGDGHHALFRHDGDNDQGEAVKSKVEELSGLGINRLGVGGNFCVALTKEQSLLLWTPPCSGTVKKTPGMAFVPFHRHPDSNSQEVDPVCPECLEPMSTEYIGGLKLMHCSNCGYADYTNIDEPHNDPKKKAVVIIEVTAPKGQLPQSKKTSGSNDKVNLVMFNKERVRCIKCNSKCSIRSLGVHAVNYCKPCNYLPRDTDYVNTPQAKKGKPQSKT